jgi:hypothetical protein
MMPMPPLMTRRFGDALTLSWPATAASYTLHTTTLLSPPVLWSVVTNLVLFENDVCSVLLSAREPARYFQLVGP